MEAKRPRVPTEYQARDNTGAVIISKSNFLSLASPIIVGNGDENTVYELLVKCHVEPKGGAEYEVAPGNERVSERTHEIRLKYSPTYDNLDAKCILIHEVTNEVFEVLTRIDEPYESPSEIVLQCKSRVDLKNYA